MCAVFLRFNVVLVHVGNSVLKHTVVGSHSLVSVVFHGAKAVVTDLFKACRQEETQAEAGQLRELHVALYKDVGCHSAGDGHCPVNFNIHELLYRECGDGHVRVDAHLAVRCHIVGAVGPGHGLVVVGCHPVEL